MKGTLTIREPVHPGGPYLIEGDFDGIMTLASALADAVFKHGANVIPHSEGLIDSSGAPVGIVISTTRREA